MGKQGLNGATQQRCVVAGHGSHDQQFFLRLGFFLFRPDFAEMQQGDKGLVQKNLLLDGYGHAIDNCFLETEGRLGKPTGGAFKKLQRGAHGPACAG